MGQTYAESVALAQRMPTLSFAVFRKVRVAGAQRLSIFASMTPAEEVQAILDRKGWTQYELAKRAELPRSTVKRILEGADAKTSTLDAIRNAAKSRKREG